MRRLITILIFCCLALSFLYIDTSLAAVDTYAVKPGDTLWIIASKYQVGLSELIDANPQLKNPDLIYPGQKITVPLMDEIKAIENQVVALVNQERVKRGIPRLANNWQLARVARFKSEDMRDSGYFSHTSPIYGSPFNMIRSFWISFSAAGENIAKGQKTPKEVMNSWMGSSGHRGNILNWGFTQIGAGYATDYRGTAYWTQMFIKP